MKKYEITWLNGETEVLEGRNIINALRESGFSQSYVSYIKSFKDSK